MVRHAHHDFQDKKLKGHPELVEGCTLPTKNVGYFK
jgi:hypothetical protein